MHCGQATPTDPGVPPRVATTGAFEVSQVTKALAGRYRVERVLGEGGMATVYLAGDDRHGRQVAVKVMRPELAATLGADRFLREVQIAAKLNHPNILAMYDSGQADGLLYYVMPYVEGETLKERLERDGALPPEEALRLAREIAEALAYAHKRGIIHRDIKPANILLNEGHALVADFGIARALEEGEGGSLTKTGLAIGTPQYMAPEQATGEKDVDGRADLYATGAILYEMLTGEPPFTGQNARAVLTKSLTEAPRPVTQVRPGVPAAMDAVVQKALAKQADGRYASATEFMAALDMLRSQSSGAIPALRPDATQVTGAARAADARTGSGAWRSPRTLALAALAAVAAVAVFVALRGRSGGGGAASGAPSGNRVVVLPFHSTSGQDDFHVVSGLSNQVRLRLGQIGGLKVIASGTSNAYKDSKESPTAIAREVGADYVLTGEARRGESGLELATTLLDARSGGVRWEDRVDLSGSDLALVPSRVGAAVASQLGVTPTPEEQRRLEAPPTTSADAFRAYLQASGVSGTDLATIREQRQLLEQAVALDANFAEAWSALARSVASFYSNAVEKNPADVQRAREALERAEQLAPGAIHVRRARYQYLSQVVNDRAGAAAELDGMLREAPNDPALLAVSANGDLERAELGTALAKLERAREVDPRSPSVQGALAGVYSALSRGEDAIKAAEARVEVQPLSASAAQNHAITYIAHGDLEGARRALRAAVTRGIPALKLGVQMAGFWEIGFALDESDQQAVLRLTPAAFDGSRVWWAQSLATLHWQRGDTAQARAHADSALAPSRQALAANPNDSQMHGLLALMLAYLGREGDARAEMAKSLAYRGTALDRWYNLVNAAKTEVALGNRDAALAHLKTAQSLGSWFTGAWLRVDPTFATLRGYPPAEEWMGSPAK